jgi:O-antigen/teichoic acid export membrane protein
MQIGRKDVVWNFAGTFMRVASGLIVLPLVLHLLPSQEVGLWNIFLTVGGLAALLDFGFSNAFSRNITYIFSGVKELKKEGLVIVEESDKSVDYGLLKSLILAMRKYYAILAAVFLVIFLVVSPFYLPYVFEKNHYGGNRFIVDLSWLIYGVLVAYQLYTYYYGSLLIGRGYVKKYQQIIIIGQGARIISSAILLLFSFGIISLVIGQLLSDVITRTLSYKIFYDKEIKEQMALQQKRGVKEIMSVLTPNALKMGTTLIRGFFIYQAGMLIASIYLPLSTIAEFGTTRQMIELISSFGMIRFSTYYPKMTYFKANDEKENLKQAYIKSILFLIVIFVVCGVGLLIVGPPLLTLIHSKTHLLPFGMTLLMLIIALLELNSGMATSFLVMKNEVPFYKAMIISGVCSFILSLFLFNYTSLGVLCLIFGQGISQIVYMNWKWPYVVLKELNVKFADYLVVAKLIIKENVRR